MAGLLAENPFDEAARLLAAEPFRAAMVEVGRRVLTGLLAFVLAGYPLMLWYFGMRGGAGPRRRRSDPTGLDAAAGRMALRLALAAFLGFLALRQWLPALAAAIVLAYPIYRAIRRLPPALVLSMRALGAPPRALFWRVLLPWTAPAFLRGLRLALTVLAFFCVMAGTRVIVAGLAPYQLDLAGRTRHIHHAGVLPGAALIFLAAALPINAVLMALGRLLVRWREPVDETPPL